MIVSVYKTKVQSMNKMIWFVAILLVGASLFSGAESPFVLIMYDKECEKEIGSFPPNRTVWAETMLKLQQAGTKCIVLKFFFDLPKTAAEVMLLPAA